MHDGSVPLKRTLAFTRRGRSGEELEGLDVPRPHGREISVVEGGDGGDTEAFSDRHDGGVDGPEWQLPIRPDEFRDPEPVSGLDTCGDQDAAGEVEEPAVFEVRPITSPVDQVRHFGQGRLREEERTGSGRDQLRALAMPALTRAERREHNARVDQESDGSSLMVSR